MAAAGDVNGDGYSDIVVGAPYASQAGSDKGGAAYVIYGGPDHHPVDLANLGTGGLTIKGGVSGGSVGWSVSGGGDVNGDGLSDVLIGAPYSLSGASRGLAYVLEAPTPGALTDFGTTGNDTLVSGVPEPHMDGGLGNDVLTTRGALGQAFVAYGGPGNDTIIAKLGQYTGLPRFLRVNGGPGIDTFMPQSSGTLNLDLSTPRLFPELHSIEVLDFTQAVVRSQISPQAVLALSDTHTLTVNTDGNDSITPVGDWTAQQGQIIDSHHYQVFTSGLATLMIEDEQAPTITSVSSTNLSGDYGVGSTISITVTFSKPVSVTGTPLLSLATNNGAAVATYSTGSGTNTLTFLYTVKTGDQSSDLGYASTTALDLNGGTIIDSAANNAVTTLPSPDRAALWQRMPPLPSTVWRRRSSTFGSCTATTRASI